jgi:hypothetical protein
MQRYIDYFVLPNFYIGFLHLYGVFMAKNGDKMGNKDKKREGENRDDRRE